MQLNRAAIESPATHAAAWGAAGVHALLLLPPALLAVIAVTTLCRRVGLVSQVLATAAAVAVVTGLVGLMVGWMLANPRPGYQDAGQWHALSPVWGQVAVEAVTALPVLVALAAALALLPTRARLPVLQHSA